MRLREHSNRWKRLREAAALTPGHVAARQLVQLQGQPGVWVNHPGTERAAYRLLKKQLRAQRRQA